MIKVNSLSGGKTSSYIAVNYPADYNVFSLVRTNDKLCQYPDKKVRQIVSDLLGRHFEGTPEQDNIIPIMLDLSEKINVEWVTGKTFEDVIKDRGNYLPNIIARYCTTELKMRPIFDFWKKEVNEVCDMRIGFRKGEERRKKNIVKRLNEKGIEEMKVIVGKSENGRNRWGSIEWRRPSFPLIEDGIKAIDIENYWNKNKWVGFKKGYYNNCVGCFHRSPLFLNKMAQEHRNKMEWFAKMEEKTNNTFIKTLSYNEIIRWNMQTELSFDDFDECDSGYCGL
tara:strand:+ start:1450 stop:2292 length:843 start_codon:yes stop_codon:yes gene_type:complete